MLVILDHVLLRISFISLHRPKYKIIPAKRGSAVTITVGFVGLIVSFQNLVTRQIMIFHCFDIFSKHKSQNGKRVKGCPHNPTHDEEGRGSFLRMNRERGRSGVSTHSQREEVRSLFPAPPNLSSFPDKQDVSSNILADFCSEWLSYESHIICFKFASFVFRGFP